MRDDLARNFVRVVDDRRDVVKAPADIATDVPSGLPCRELFQVVG
jgi:hypothetical protein